MSGNQDAGGSTVTTSGTGTSTSIGGQLAVQDACKQAAAAVCNRTSACTGAIGLAGMGYTSVSECIAGRQAAGCATVAQASCDSGQTYHADQARLCVDGFSVLSCTDLGNGLMPAACDLVCSGSGTGINTGIGTASNTSTGTGASGGGGGSGGSGGAPGTLSYEQALAAAPPDWAFAGTNSQWGQLSFNIPKNWTATVLSDAVQLTSPGAAGSQCFIFVLAPRTVVTDETGRFQALLSVVQGLFPSSSIQGEYGPDTMTWRTKGLAGGGWDYVGLNLHIDSISSLPWMAIFGSTAVPVVPLEPSGASCLSSQTGEVDGLEIFHTMKLSSFASPSPAPLKDQVVGNWFSASGSVGIGLILGANLQYSSTATLASTVAINSYQVRDVYSTWSGDGSYVSVGNIDAYFPTSGTKPPHSSYVRVYQEENTSDPSGWITRHCEIHRSTVDAMGPYEICLTKQP